jgi:hypothetical protein
MVVVVRCGADGGSFLCGSFCSSSTSDFAVLRSEFVASKEDCRSLAVVRQDWTSVSRDSLCATSSSTFRCKSLTLVSWIARVAQ